MSKYGDHFLSLDWKSPESQEIRYSIFADHAKHMAYITSMLIRMAGLCKIAVGCNFLSSQARKYLTDDDLRYDYHLGDFTVYLLK